MATASYDTPNAYPRRVKCKYAVLRSLTFLREYNINVRTGTFRDDNGDVQNYDDFESAFEVVVD